MSIESVNNERQVYPVDDKTKINKQNQPAGQEAVKPAQPADMLSISDEVKNISHITANINADVYGKPEVLRDVALKLMQELYPSGENQ
jgi:hypothetical protein